MYDEVKFLFSGDCSVVVEFGNEINPKLIAKVRQLVNLLEKENIKGVIEWIPTYRSILITYNPCVISYNLLKEKLQSLMQNQEDTSLECSYVTEIPTVYGGEYGPDLNYVASYNNLSPEEVIAIHSSANYLIYMLGFTPGFPYLGGMSEKIATPRLKTPREIIPQGSVGIASNQTGIYPIASPGGWQLIGRTPISLFQPEKPEPFLLEAGHYLRFVPISADEYLAIAEKYKQGEYNIKRYTLKKDGDQLGT